jgi:formylmethanofuran dehydrogenase subunit D
VENMTATKIELTLITGRTIDQGAGKELGKGSKEYFEAASICLLDKVDMIKAKEYPRGTHPGIVFIPCGLWANAVCGDKTYSMGMPLFKGFPVQIEPAQDKPILTLDELLKEEYGKEIP